MLDMAFKLSSEEKGLPPDMAPADAPDVALDALDVAPPLAPAEAAAPPPLAPAQAAAAAAPGPGRHYIVPAAVLGASRNIPRQDAGEISYLG